MIYSNTYHHLFTHQPSDSPSPYAIKAAQPPPPPLTGKGSQHQHQATLQPLIPPVKKTITGKQQQQPQPQPKQQPPLLPQKSAAAVPVKAVGKSEKKQQPPQQPNPKGKPAPPAADTLSLGKRVALAVKRRSKVSLAEQGNSVGLGKERGGSGQTPKVTVIPSDANGEEDGISMLLAAQPPPKPPQPPPSPRPK